MDSPVHSNKKTILLAAAAIVATLIMLFIAIFTINAGKRTRTNSELTEVVNEKDTDPVQKTNSEEKKPTEAIVEPGWNNYKNSLYSMDYPNEWEAKEVVFTGGGTGQSIKPIINKSNASFSIAVDSASSVEAAKQKQESYKKLGFKESVFQIGGQQATRISGQLPPKATSGTPPPVIMRSVYIFLEREGRGYFVEYAYTGADVDLQLEKTFETMISSIKFL